MTPEESLDMLVELATAETEFDAIYIANNALGRHDFPSLDEVDERVRQGAEALARRVKDALDARKGIPFWMRSLNIDGRNETL